MLTAGKALLVAATLITAWLPAHRAPLPAAGKAIPAAAAAASTKAATAKDVTANLFMWNWPSVAAECTNVLGPDGYAAVQVAPPQDSLDTAGHPWWEIYQPVDYQLTSRMGDADQFRSMVATCHAAGVRVYVDAVLNHMAAQSGQGSSYGGVPYTPGTSYPDYGSADFHQYPQDCPVSGNGISDWNDYQQVTECQLDGLPDLRTESSSVRATLAGYLNTLIGDGVDGFRLDAAKHIGHTDLAAIESLLHPDTTTGQPVYITQEVEPGATNSQLTPASFENTGSLLGFDYADALKTQFDGGTIAQFSGFSGWNLLPSDKSSSFVNNHDTERDGSTLSYQDGATYDLATEFLLAFGYGTPQVYAGFEFSGTDDSPPADGNGYVSDTDCASGWYCTDRLPGVANMVAWHNLALTDQDPVANFGSDGTNMIWFSRGSDAWIAVNNETSAQTHTVTTGLPDGTYCDIIHGTVTGGRCTAATVTVSGGQATVTVPAKDAVAIDVDAFASPTAGPQETVTVTVPAATPSGATVDLAGNLSVLGAGQPDWAPDGIPMTRIDATHFTTTIHATTEAALQYKYTLDGTWSNTEETGGCGYVANRTLTVDGGTEADTVATWQGYSPC